MKAKLAYKIGLPDFTLIYVKNVDGQGIWLIMILLTHDK